MDGGQDLLRLQQDADAARRERRIDEWFLPGSAPPDRSPARIGEEADCFVIRDIRVEGAGETLRPADQRQALRDFQGRCLGLAAIRELQARLTNALVERGYVTSRVVMPEQTLQDGTLRVIVVPGRIERYDSAFARATVRMAFPGHAGDVLRLPALEQGLENLNRLPGKDVQLALAPGTDNGLSVVQVNDAPGRRWQWQATVDGRGLEDAADLRGRLAVTAGDLFGLAERVTLSASRNLDDHRLDHSTAASADISVPYGYWLFAASHDRQAYRDDVAGTAIDFDTDGTTQTTRLELSRVLHRQGHRRLALALGAGDMRTANRVADTPVEVSSYGLRTLSARLEHSTRLAHAQWTTWLTVESGDAYGKATHPLGGAAVADTQALRTQVYVRALQPLGDGSGAVVVTLNGQHAASQPYPAQQFSLTADSAVRGFVDASASGTNAMAWRAEWQRGLAAASARLPGSLQSFVGGDIGWLRNDDSRDDAARAASLTAGVLWYDDAWQVRLQASDPVGGVTTLRETAPTWSMSLAWTL